MPPFRRLARLEARSAQPDGAGGFASGWALLAEHRVALIAASGSERFEANRQTGRVTHRITLRSTPAFRPRTDHRFAIGARHFDIRAVFDRDGRGRFLTCLCEESP